MVTVIRLSYCLHSRFYPSSRRFSWPASTGVTRIHCARSRKLRANKRDTRK